MIMVPRRMNRYRYRRSTQRKGKRRVAPHFSLYPSNLWWGHVHFCPPHKDRKKPLLQPPIYHTEWANSRVSEELGASLKHDATHFQQCLAVAGRAIVDEDGTPLNPNEDPKATSARRREQFGWALIGRCVIHVTLFLGYIPGNAAFWFIVAG